MQSLIIATDSDLLIIKNKLQTKTKLKTLLFVSYYFVESNVDNSSLL